MPCCAQPGTEGCGNARAEPMPITPRRARKPVSAAAGGSQSFEQGGFEARMAAGWARMGQKSEGDLAAAVSHFCAAVALRPCNVGARMAAGKALRKMARFCADRGSGERADDCHRRAIEHYEHAMSSSDSGGILEPGYWKGVCMLHLGRGRGEIEAFVECVLKSACPRNRAGLALCGRICDILGDYGTACDYYGESLAGNSLYTDGFCKRIDRRRIGAEGTTAARQGTAGLSSGGAAGGRGAPAVCVLDANVVVECAAGRDATLEPDVVSALVEGIRSGGCRIPAAAFNEAYGIVKAKKDGDLGALLRAWGAELELIRGRGAMDYSMKRAREALMTAWLYSDKNAKRSWRNRKFGRGRAPYTGGPPQGKDVVILATAAHLAHAGGKAGPRPVVLVTSDADFLSFRRHIREVLSIDVERPDDAAWLLVRAARERERLAGMGRRAAGTGRVWADGRAPPARRGA